MESVRVENVNTQLAPHPNAHLHVQKCEGRVREEVVRREGKEIERLMEQFIREVAMALQSIAVAREGLVQYHRGLETERKQVFNEQIRVRARLEDEWLRGIEKLLYSDFLNESKRVKLIMSTADPNLLPKGKGSTNAALIIALSKSKVI